MLQNIRIGFDPVADRLALTIVAKLDGGELQEHRLELTRRICQGWRNDLQAMVDLSAEAPAQLGPQARAAVSQTHHEAMASQADVRKAPDEPVAQAGSPPALVTRIVCGRRRSDGQWVLRFELRERPSVTVAMGGKTLHGFVAAVLRRLKTANWNLPPLPVETPSPVTDEPDRHFH